MNILITGSGGLIGGEACRHWLTKHARVHGIDNNCRRQFFGSQGDVTPVINSLKENKNYTHHNIDIRDREAILDLFVDVRPDVIIHCAAQPSHDKAAAIPFDDFDVNAVGTINLLEASRRLDHDDLVFIHMSTNKVYGDAPNKLGLCESDKRYDYANENFTLGISESLSIDNCLHSLFGASKVAADIVAQEYGRYFGMNIGIFRGGCLTGPQHAGVELHGFLSYIVKCAISKKPYTIFGYKGKQVRDQIHCTDVISAFECFIKNPKQGEVYNIGGCKQNSASILEIIDILRNDHNLNLNYTTIDKNRVGDHICYYTDMTKFMSDFPTWTIEYSLNDIIKEIVDTENKTMK